MRKKHLIIINRFGIDSKLIEWFHEMQEQLSKKYLMQFISMDFIRNSYNKSISGKCTVCARRTYEQGNEREFQCNNTCIHVVHTFHLFYIAFWRSTRKNFMCFISVPVLFENAYTKRLCVYTKRLWWSGTYLYGIYVMNIRLVHAIHWSKSGFLHMCFCICQAFVAAHMIFPSFHFPLQASMQQSKSKYISIQFIFISY